MSIKDTSPCIETTQSFLETLSSSGEFTFQTFDDNQMRKDKKLVRIYHGRIEEHYEALIELNGNGAGVFVTINETDLRGRKLENIENVRAVFADLDGAPLEPVLKHVLEPHIIVESSPNRWHCYWLCKLSKDDFSAVQLRISEIFQGDKAIKDLARVMRLPGFYHQKIKNQHNANPFLTRIEQISTDETPYSSEEILEHFSPSQNHGKLGVSDQCTNADNNPTETEIIEMLKFLSPSDREEWVKVGHSLKAINQNFLTLFLEFSRGEYSGFKPSNYVSDSDVISSWNSFKPTRSGFGSLINLAKRNGYTTPTSSVSLKTGSQVELAYLMKQRLDELFEHILFDEGQFWVYQNLHWQKKSHDDIRPEIHKLDGLKFGKSRVRLGKYQVDGIINELAIICRNAGFFKEACEGVNLANGFVTISSEGNILLEPHSPEHRQRIMLKQSYIPELSSEFHGLLGKLFRGCFGGNNEELSELILQIWGATICGIGVRLAAPQAFIFYGNSAANGKSVMLSVLREILPPNAVCSITPADLDKEQYLAKLNDKHANLSDEMSGIKSIASEKFKAVITGDVVTAKTIYMEPFDFKPIALHIISTNVLPSFKGGVDAGISRRLTVIPFNKTIPTNERIPDLAKLLILQEGDIVVSKAIRAAAELKKSGVYSIPQICFEETQLWLREADPINQWLEEGGLARNVSKKYGSLLRDLYIGFCENMREEGITYIPSKRRFNAQLRAFVENSVEWEERRYSDGFRVFYSDLVTQVNKFA
ncbi:MAG: phage/plasmid primase, P4 family [Candidatus Micropelagos thuwalensis]